MYTEKKDFLPGLHVLRGLAATVTILFHLRFMGPGLKVHYLTVVEQLGVGVTLFFILSCFSLFHSTRSKMKYPNWLAGYVLRRFYRIFPLFFLMVLFYLLSHYILFGKVYSLAEILLNLSVLYQFYPGYQSSIVMAGWTVGVEVTFYCLFPMLFCVSRSFKFWMTAFVVTLIISIIISDINLNKSYIYMSFPRQLFVFILGGVIYILARKRSAIGKQLSLALLFVLLTAWWLATKGYFLSYPLFDFFTLKVLVMGTLVYYFHDSDVLFNRFTKFLGEASYIIYLSHPAVIQILRPVLKNIYGFSLPVDFCFVISFLLVFSVVLIVSFFVHKYIEMPIYYYGVKKAIEAEIRS